MKNYFGFFVMVVILGVFLFSIFYLLEERKSSWNISIKQSDTKKISKFIQTFTASKKYKKHFISISADTATEYKNQKIQHWLLKNIKLVLTNKSKKKIFFLKSKSAVFYNRADRLSFLNTSYVTWHKSKIIIENLIYDLKNNQLLGSKGVSIVHSNFKLSSDNLKIFLNTNKIKYILTGRVQAQMDKQSFTGEKIVFDPADQSIEIKSGNIKIDESLNF